MKECPHRCYFPTHEERLCIGDKCELYISLSQKFELVDGIFTDAIDIYGCSLAQVKEAK